MKDFKLDVKLKFREYLTDKELNTLSGNKNVKIKGFDTVEFLDVKQHGEQPDNPEKYFINLKDRTFNFDADNVSDVYIHLNTPSNNLG